MQTPQAVILTGCEIQKEYEEQRITLEPFSKSQINPNSYNYRLAPRILIPHFKEGDEKISFKERVIQEDGFVLERGKMILGHTLETIGSSHFAMSLIGRSSIGRYGLFLQISANLGHTTSSHSWTLEIFATQSICLYPRMTIGQVSFWKNNGLPKCFGKTYALFNTAQESLEL